MEYFFPTFQSIHDAKISICYILKKIDRPIIKDHLYSIIDDSRTMDYFMFSQALSELEVNETISIRSENGEETVFMTEKCVQSAAFFEDSIHIYFKNQLRRSAFYFLTKLAHQKQADIDIIKTKHGYEVTGVIKDTNFDLLRITLYAPDYYHAELIRDKIYNDPIEYYKKIMNFTLYNKEPVFDNEIDGIFPEE